jgi:hypothetical protein
MERSSWLLHCVPSLSLRRNRYAQLVKGVMNAHCRGLVYGNLEKNIFLQCLRVYRD